MPKILKVKPVNKTGVIKPNMSRKDYWSRRKELRLKYK